MYSTITSKELRYDICILLKNDFWAINHTLTNVKEYGMILVKWQKSYF